MSLLSERDLGAIEAAVREAESKTAGEIATVVCERSNDYAAWRAFSVVLVTVALSTVVDRAWPYVLSSMPTFDHVLPHDVSGWLIPAQLAIAAGLWRLSGVAAITRRLVPGGVKALAVSTRAKQAFLDHGVTETRDRSGVLIFVSELEHRVEILADRGIHARVGVDGWQENVETIVTAIHADRAGAGIVEVVERIGEELGSAFPRRDDDENELPDAVQRARP